MNPTQLLAHFDRLADAPDALPRLRRFILDLAVRGKLVEQDPNDEPASELLKLVSSKGNQVLSDLLPRWIKAKVGALLDFQYGKPFPASERLEQGRVSVYGSNGIVGYGDESLTDNAAIIIGRKGSAGALNLCIGPSWTTDVAYFVTPPSFFDIGFLLIALQTLDLGNLGKGVKPGLSRSDAYDLDIMVPPLAEQHRIVAKVDELMALCDQLEAAQTERERRRDACAAASLNRLNQPDADPSAFRESARFHLAHLPRLTARPEQIQQLRQTILSLAVQGKLVERDPSDEPASELLNHVQANRIEAKTKTKGSGIATHLDADEIPFRLPENWKWVLLGNVLRVTSSRRIFESDYVSSGVPFYRSKEIGELARTGFTRNNFYISKERYKELKSLPDFPNNGDLLLTSVGSIGNTWIVDEREFYFKDGNVTQLIQSESIDMHYVQHYIASPLFIDAVSETVAGTAYNALTIIKIKHLKFPLPPLAEQHRIVAKVDELIALCDQLEAQLTVTQSQSRRLLEAVLQEALAVAA